MSKGIDQSIFESKLLLFGQHGILEKKRLREKFNTAEFFDAQNHPSTNLQIPQEDSLFRSQFIEALRWLLTSLPIQLTAEHYSRLMVEALTLRVDLDSNMQPKTLLGRVFKNSSLKSDSVSRLDRVDQAKINISNILIKINTTFKNNYLSISLLDRKLNPALLSGYFQRCGEEFKSTIKSVNPHLKWNSDFHILCIFSTLCYWSIVKRIQNFPGNTESPPISKIYSRIEEAVLLLTRGRMDQILASRILDFYISNFGRSNKSCDDMTESEIWNCFCFELGTGIFIEIYNIGGEIFDFVSVAELDFKDIMTHHIIDFEIVNVGETLLSKN